MDLVTGPSKTSWHPVMSMDTTTSSYWLNWRVLVCSMWILGSLVLTLFVISKYECPRTKRRETAEENEAVGVLYEDELWKPCLRGIHPVWLLGYRLVAFLVLLIMLILNVAVDGGRIMDYYTQWTFTLITIYFGLGFLISMYGCYKYRNKVSGDGIGNLEQGTTHASVSVLNSSAASSAKSFGTNGVGGNRQITGFWGYVFQVIFQMNAGAVMLTDAVFWCIMVPFLELNDYDLNFLKINMHSINAFFLLGEAALNSLRFPWFRIVYFFLWTTVYAIFQWILHMVISTWWPYPFLDLADSFAPLWYTSMALLHIPCFGVFALLMKMKHSLLSRFYPESYQCVI